MYDYKSNELLVMILFSDQKPTGVWSSQVETDYLKKWSERPAPDWLTKIFLFFIGLIFLLVLFLYW